MAYTNPAPVQSLPQVRHVSIGVRLRSPLGFNLFWISFVNMDKTHAGNLIPVEGYGAAESARNIFRQFLKTQDTHLLMLDDDCVLGEQTLNRLLSRNLPVVAALTWTKGFPTLPTIWRGLSGVDQGFPSWWVRQDEVAKWFEDPRITAEITANQNKSAFTLSCEDRDLLKRTDVIGLHCTLIRRDVIEGVGEPFMKADDTGVREDFDFSQRIAHIGHDIFVDMSACVGHINVHPTSPLDYYIWETYKEADAKAKPPEEKK